MKRHDDEKPTDGVEDGLTRVSTFAGRSLAISGAHGWFVMVDGQTHGLDRDQALSVLPILEEIGVEELEELVELAGDEYGSDDIQALCDRIYELALRTSPYWSSLALAWMNSRPPVNLDPDLVRAASLDQRIGQQDRQRLMTVLRDL